MIFVQLFWDNFLSHTHIMFLLSLYLLWFLRQCLFFFVNLWFTTRYSSFSSDLHAKNNPHEYLRILLQLPLVRRSFLRIKMPQEHPQVTIILLRILVLTTYIFFAPALPVFAFGSQISRDTGWFMIFFIFT